MNIARTFLIVAAAAMAAGCQKTAGGDAAEPAPPVPPATSTPSADSATMSNPGVQVTLDRTSYNAGAMVTLTLVNGTARDLGYNACTRIVEREVSGAWTAVPEPDRVCTMELRLLAKGETVKEQTDLPAAAAGRYRIALNFSDESASAGAPVRAVSAPFTIQ